LCSLSKNRNLTPFERLPFSSGRVLDPVCSQMHIALFCPWKFISTMLFFLATVFMIRTIMVPLWNIEWMYIVVGVCLDGCAGWTVARPDVLAQVTRPRIGETCRNRPKLALELSLRRRAFVWARHHLAQAREARLSEDAWGLEVCCCMRSLGKEALFGRGAFSPKQVATCLSENPRISQGSLMTVSPKRDPVARARLARDFSI